MVSGPVGAASADKTSPSEIAVRSYMTGALANATRLLLSSVVNGYIESSDFNKAGNGFFLMSFMRRLLTPFSTSLSKAWYCLRTFSNVPYCISAFLPTRYRSFRMVPLHKPQ